MWHTSSIAHAVVAAEADEWGFLETISGVPTTRTVHDEERLLLLLLPLCLGFDMDEFRALADDVLMKRWSMFSLKKN
jgi:hypothetical protein